MKRNLRKWMAVVLAVVLCVLTAVLPVMAADAGTWEPDSLIVGIGGTEESLSFTWYDTTKTPGVLHLNGKDYTASVSSASKSGSYVNRVTVDGLTAATKYKFTITSGDGKLSKTHTYVTKDFGKGKAFTFAAVGDPQIGASGNAETDSQGWKKTLNAIQKDDADYAFLFSMGDQVNTNTDESEYSYFLSPMTAETAVLPFVNMEGNHDVLAKNYTDHFTDPNVTSYGTVLSGDGDYSFTYNGVLFMVLNTNNLSVSQHKAFLEQTVAEHEDATWKVVCFHKSVYSVANHVTDTDISVLRDGLSPILAALDVDVVLQGHDHVYARSYIMGGESGKEADTSKGVQKDIYQPDGVQYVTLNSSSGSKFYSITSEAFTYTAVQNQEKVPNYSRVTVTEDSFTVTTYRVTDHSVVDTFTLHKNAKGSASDSADADDEVANKATDKTTGATEDASAGATSDKAGAQKAGDVLTLDSTQSVTWIGILTVAVLGALVTLKIWVAVHRAQHHG